MRRSRIPLLLAALAALLALTAAPAGAIIDGQRDMNNIYANVGMLATWSEEDGIWVPHGSGTLVKNDKDGIILLGAAHTVAWLGWVDESGVVQFDFTNTRVSFQPMTDRVSQGQILEGGMQGPLYEIVAWQVPGLDDYIPYYKGNAKLFGIGPGREDIVLLWLRSTDPRTEKRPTATPATIVSEGALDAIDLKQATFTVVGYGVNGFTIPGSVVSRGTLDPDLPWTGRNYRGSVSVVTEHDAYGDRYLKLTECIASHDCGGSVLYDGRLAAMPIWADSMRFEGHAYMYRLDTPFAQDFVARGLSR